MDKIKVSLLNYTNHPDLQCAQAASLCYGNKEKLSDIKCNNILKHCIESGHMSILEHASFTFLIEDCSRICTHQLVRHRIASYSQLSNRYKPAIDEDVLLEHNIVIPDSIKKHVKYEKILHILAELDDLCLELKHDGIKDEDYRYLIPHGLRTSIVVTMNGRTLYNFFALRCCLRAQKEIRIVADMMLNYCKDVAPIMFENAGPDCVRGECAEKYCPGKD